MNPESFGPWHLCMDLSSWRDLWVDHIKRDTNKTHHRRPPLQPSPAIQGLKSQTLRNLHQQVRRFSEIVSMPTPASDGQPVVPSVVGMATPRSGQALQGREVPRRPVTTTTTKLTTRRGRTNEWHGQDAR